MKIVGAAVAKKQASAIDAHVGNQIRLRRALIGMSQERLGELLGLTFQQIQKYEKGVNRIGAGRLYEIARILEIGIPYFYEGAVDGAGQPVNSKIDGAAPAELMSYLTSPEGLQLNLAFMRITDTKVRKRVLDLVKSLAEGGGGPDPLSSN